MKNVLIITGTTEANKKVDEFCASAGMTIETGDYSIGVVGVLIDDSGQCGVSHENGVTALAKLQGGLECTVYHHSELTPELVATFPGARELPPPGPFEYKGKMCEVDGDEKRFPSDVDIFVAEYGGGYTCATTTDGVVYDVAGEDERWILRPIISPELQAAIDHQRQTAKAVSETRKANKEALERVKVLGGKV